MTSSSSEKKFFQNSLKIPFTISTERFHVINADLRGHNRMYDDRRSRSFLFELDRCSPDTNDYHLLIHTNDTLVSTLPKQYFSTSRIMNHKFQISKLLTHFFTIQRVIPNRVQHKYFDKIRNLLISRISHIENRKTKKQRNRITNTFFNFSYKKYRFHFGIYVLCNHMTTQGICPLPSAIVLSNHRTGCVYHQKWSLPPDSSHDIPPHLKFAAANKQTYNKWKYDTTHQVHSCRLGISYSTKIKPIYESHGYSQDVQQIYAKKFFNYSTDAHAHHTSYSSQTMRKQLLRRERQLKNIQSTNVHTPEVLRNSLNGPLPQLVYLARKSYTLFDPSVLFFKRIDHLNFNKLKHKPAKTFPLPPKWHHSRLNRSKVTHTPHPIAEVSANDRNHQST
ncbi:hypothetical protein C1645_744078 [Glomus cerebriforme]|uniref:DUF8211 domain-containing protein n=1 Tax=Glomus cerebriforme TaxID=658196 RepID=A0A397S6N4_9GLOM|nr:hypothetical protein C1645_744078 [Glomus cerebriforme]